MRKPRNGGSFVCGRLEQNRKDAVRARDPLGRDARMRCWTLFASGQKIRAFFFNQSSLGRARGVGGIDLQACEGGPRAPLVYSYEIGGLRLDRGKISGVKGYVAVRPI